MSDVLLCLIVLLVSSLFAVGLVFTEILGVLYLLFIGFVFFLSWHEN